jgi:hypothetical protein
MVFMKNFFVNTDGEVKLIFTIRQRSNLFPEINKFISKIHRRGLLTKQSAQGWKKPSFLKTQPMGFFGSIVFLVGFLKATSGF